MLMQFDVSKRGEECYDVRCHGAPLAPPLLYSLLGLAARLAAPDTACVPCHVMAPGRCAPIGRPAAGSLW